MCLAVPGKIISIDKDTAIVDYDVEQRSVKFLEDKYNVGDYVIVQAGLIIDKVPEQEAKRSLELYKEALV